MSDAGSRRPAQIRHLGQVFYPAGLRMQQGLADFVAREGRPDQILLLGHDPVFTLGRNATRADIHVTDAFLAEAGVSLHETDRGGQVTYHGPGQVVVYPICNLQGSRADLGRLVRGLEEAMIRTAADWSIAAYRIPEHPGIWVDTARGPEKLGAVGLHLRRWITTHGIAFNVDPDLSRYRWITPCGIPDKGVCSMHSLLGPSAPDPDQAARALAGHLVDVLDLDPLPCRPPSRSVNALTWRRGPGGPEVLMMLRQPDQGLWWSSVTGMLEDGEEPEAAAHREVLEETGLRGTLRPLGLVHSFWVDPALIRFPDDEPRFNTETCFHMEVEGDQELRLDPSEHSEHRWCSVPEAKALMRWEGSRAALGLLARELGGSLPSLT
ncbi:MAG: lipoyl(octanoyl) transferase LipB [Acidobacteria bacterium]|nr:lipoyl(octanoyl) transferase LipB [Acidobacteriota bacterium]